MGGELAIGVEIAGHRVESVIGHGGMGVVYLAEHLRLGRKVALKVLTPDLARDEGFRRRFVRESQLAASLDHPNIITIYDAGEVDGVLYISMRYVNGPGLDDVLRASRTLSPQDALWVLEHVAAALDVAHAEGLVHRDVKPGNVLLRRRTDRAVFDHVYLTDFGITKSLRGGAVQTQTAQFVGTIDYTAPEQISGGSIDGRTDVYSLGCVLYQCLSGEPPYHAESLIQVMYAHLQDPPPAVSSRRPDLPWELDGVLKRALAKRPQARFGSCTELVHAAREALTVASNAPNWMVAPSSLAQGDQAEITVRDPRVVRSRSQTPVLTPPATGRRSARRRRRFWLVVASLLVMSGVGLTLAALAFRGDAPSRPPPAKGPSRAAAKTSTPPIRGAHVVWGRPLTGGLVFGGAGDQLINRAIATANGIIAVGSDSSAGGVDPAVWRFDGSGWEKAGITAGAGGQGIAGVVEAGPRFVAVGTDYAGTDTDAAVWTSEHGVFWNRVNSQRLRRAGDQVMTRVVNAEPGLLAVGTVMGANGNVDASVWGSADGRSWTVLGHPVFGGPGSQIMLSAASFRSGVVVVGDAIVQGDMDAAAWRFDGEHWVRASRTALHLPGKQQMFSVTRGPNGLVAVGFDESGEDRDAAVWTSSDGLHWTRARAKALGGPGFQDMEGVSRTSVGFVAAGRDDPAGATWSSPDGRQWREQPPLRVAGEFPRLSAVVEFHSKLYAFGRILSHGQVDGAVWPGRLIRRG